MNYYFQLRALAGTILLWITGIFIASAQKPVIDSNVYHKWGNVFGEISNDGRFALSTAYEGVAPNATVIHQLNEKKELKIMNIRSCSFSPDSKYATYITSKDTLILLDLQTRKIHAFPNVSRYAYLVAQQQTYLVMMTRSPQDQLIINFIGTNKTKVFDHIRSFFTGSGIQTAANPICKEIWVESTEGNGSDLILNRLVVPNLRLLPIWKGSRIKNIAFGQQNSAVAFIADTAKNASFHLWYYNRSSDRAHIVISTDSLTAQKLELLGINRFNASGTCVFINMQEKRSSTPVNAGPVLDIWSYFDPKPQPLQLIESAHPRPFLYAFNTVNKKLIPIISEDGDIQAGSRDPIDVQRDNHVLIFHRSYREEAHWSRAASGQLWLISTSDGSRRLIDSLSGASETAISPDERFVVYYAPVKKNYISYEIATGNYRDLTDNIKTTWTSYERNDDQRSIIQDTPGIAGWLDDHTVLLYDQNDVFSANCKEKTSAVNLTAEYGKQHDYYFKIVPNRSQTGEWQPMLLGDKWLLSAFDRKTKEEGFFSLNIHQGNRLEELSKQPYHFSFIEKSGNADIFLVYKERADYFSNIWSSKDLRVFTPVTDIQPQKNYNWMTGELLTWQQLDGQLTQGILYKPENFDPHKKYPLIIHYYERLSDRLNYFLMPNFSTAEIDIPTYVSHGYLFLCADIHFRLGNPGQSAYNSIVAGAEYLSKEPWIDRTRIGLNGVSFGGYMTEYIVSHSNIFAAAIAASGWSDFISSSNRIRTNGNYAQDYYEVGKQRMGGSLWEVPENYVAASPIFQAQHVTTPILMMNNKQDQDADFYEGVQFFNVLRRLGKTSWMLQYDRGVHWLTDPNDIKDFTTREQQFFDHYLKGAPLPKWMAEGIPASKKGTELGYELEPDTARLLPNLLTPAEQRKVDSLEKVSPVIHIK